MLTVYCSYCCFEVWHSLTNSVLNRTLSTSDDVEDRENEKGRLEEAYEKCDRDLDELIVQHYTELTTAIRTYQSITERITNSRNKIKQVSLLSSCLTRSPSLTGVVWSYTTEQCLMVLDHCDS